MAFQKGERAHRHASIDASIVSLEAQFRLLNRPFNRYQQFSFTIESC